jgi:hypothetical protein
MQRVVLVCAALSLNVFAAPVAAQQAVPSAAAAPAEQAPPAPEPYSLPPPPPFPPMPKTDPHHRWVDTGGHRSSGKRHHTAQTHHRAATAHHSKAKGHHSKARARRSTAHQPAVHLSRRTIRQCHAMNYKQIMKHGNCRALMRQELAAADHHRRTTAHKHKAKTARHHSTKRHRR